MVGVVKHTSVEANGKSNHFRSNPWPIRRIEWLVKLYTLHEICWLFGELKKQRTTMS